MEEKNQVAERETKKDEMHEKDARNKRYVVNVSFYEKKVVDSLSTHGDRGASLSIYFTILTYIRLTDARS